MTGSLVLPCSRLTQGPGIIFLDRDWKEYAIRRLRGNCDGLGLKWNAIVRVQGSLVILQLSDRKKRRAAKPRVSFSPDRDVWGLGLRQRRETAGQ